MSKKFWQFQNSVEGDGKELVIEGVISKETWYGDEATPKQLRDELKDNTGERLTVLLNSPGGDVFAGIEMYNALVNLDAEVTVKVTGYACSIASVIAMAGDKIIMSPGSMMMVHKPWTLAIGNAEELKETIEALEKMEASILPIYTNRTGLDEGRVRELLEGEGTWMTADEAVELGFADEAIPAKQKPSEAINNALEGRLAFMMAVKTPMEDLAQKMAMQAEDVVVPAEEETKKEEEMNPEDIQKEQVLEPKAQAPVVAKATNYLASMQSVEDFSEVLMQNVGQSAADIKQAWAKVLEAKNGITNPEVLDLPEPLVSEIVDAMKRSQIYNLFNHSGMDAYKVVWDSSDLNADTSRAGQHNPDWEDGESNADKTKDQQVLTFADRVLEPDYIYKYLVLDKKTIRANRASGALMRFVMRELPARIIREMERAAIIGDGRANNHKRKITSFISVKADVVANNSFATSFTPATPMSIYETVATAKDQLLSEGSVYLIAKKGFSTSARFEKNNDGGLLFPVGTRAIDIFDVEGVIEPDWFTDATDNVYDAYLVVLGQYLTVGDNSIESFTNFKLETNENEFLQEIYKGGGLVGLKSAVGITLNQGS